MPVTDVLYVMLTNSVTLMSIGLFMQEDKAIATSSWAHQNGPCCVDERDGWREGDKGGGEGGEEGERG